MRDDEDNIRQYLPVLGRIIILVAVLTAIPVVMWTITAFVRSHIGSPPAPALQPMAMGPASAPANTTVAVASDQPPAQSVNGAQAVPLNLSANSGLNEGTSATPAPTDAPPTGGVAPAFNAASVGASSNTTPADATPAAMPYAASGSPGDSAASSDESAAPAQLPDNGAQAAAQPQGSVRPAPTTTAAADALPPGEAITGPVPLPRERPTSFAMAGNVPLPAPRPEVAGEGAAESTPTAIDWLKKVFHPTTAPVQPSDGGSDTAHE